MPVNKERYVRRLIDPLLEELVSDVPGVMLVGPRATGKTTSAMRLAQSVLRLDRNEVREAVSGGPDAVLASQRHPTLLDEWQRAPNCLAAAKRIIDADPVPGRFIFAGSATDTLSESAWPGTGRFVRVPMWGMTQREIRGCRRVQTFFDLVAADDFDGHFPLPSDPVDTGGYIDMALASGFPEALARTTERTRRAWLASYVDHLVGRDIEFIADVRNPTKFRQYVSAVASSSAGTPNAKLLIDACGIDRSTAERFDGLLERIFITEQVPAWTSNLINRISQRKKRYVCDPGLVGALIGLERRTVLRNADLLGRLIDTFVASQIRPELGVGSFPVEMFHLRQDGRREIDIVLERRDGALIAIEVKAVTEVTAHDARHLFWLRDATDDSFRAGIVFHTGTMVRSLADRIWAVPICALWGEE
jgi:uncharacterized protein